MLTLFKGEKMLASMSRHIIIIVNMINSRAFFAKEKRATVQSRHKIKTAINKETFQCHSISLFPGEGTVESIC